MIVPEIGFPIFFVLIACWLMIAVTRKDIPLMFIMIVATPGVAFLIAFIAVAVKHSILN